MAYTSVLLQTALDDLGRRLFDPNHVFWTEAEKTRILYESNRTFAAHTNFYRDEFTFPTIANTTWYDLTAVTNTLRPYTVTDLDLIKLIQNHLLEPDSGFTWTGSLQFSTTDLVQAISRRRDQLLYDTGCRITQALTATSSGIVTLADNVIDIRRIGWLPGSVYSAMPLFPDDRWSLTSYERPATLSVPSAYFRSTEPPLSFRPDVDPPVSGNWDILTVNSGPALNNVSSVILQIPDDWCWVVKWGAMADLLSRDSQARDTLRAQYCESRYAQGVEVLKRAPALLGAKIGSSILDIDAVQNQDDYNPTWQAATATQPNLLLTTGLNVVAMSPKPNAVYNITSIVLRNTPLPTNPVSDYFQFGESDYDAILDYAEHLALFKCGGAEFAQSMPLFKNFLDHCALYNRKLNVTGAYTDVLLKTSQIQDQQNPVAEPAVKEQT